MKKARKIFNMFNIYICYYTYTMPKHDVIYFHIVLKVDDAFLNFLYLMTQKSRV